MDNPIDSVNSDLGYLSLFDECLVDTDDIFDAMFILPSGKLKKIDITSQDFQKKCVFDKDKVCRLDIGFPPRHEYVKFFGFELEKLLDFGCFRIGNNISSKEIYIQAHLFNRPQKEIYDVLELCLFSYDVVVIDCTIEKPLLPYVFQYSAKNGNTIRDIKRNFNKLMNNKEYKKHDEYH